MRHPLSDASRGAGVGPAAKGVLVIGVGNAYRRDDAAGLVAARRLRAAAGAEVMVREASGEGTALMDAWEGAEAVILIDAVRSGAPAGTIFRLDARAETVPQTWFRYSTHAFSVADAIALARALNRLPPRLIVLAVEGEQFDAGVGLSPEVEGAVDELARRGLEEADRITRDV
jgi:hydrogenase maturation protease